MNSSVPDLEPAYPDLRVRVERGLAGFVVIVVGVLVALWADEAWNARTERLREHELLADLHAEFEANRVRLELDIEMSLRSGEAGRLWASAARGDIEVSADSLATLWLEAFNWGRFDPITGVLRGIIDAGELALVRDRDLRAALAGWSDLAEEARITSRGIVIGLAGQSPIALGIVPGEPLTPGQITAARVVETYSPGSLGQLTPLLAELDAIQDRIAAQLERDSG